MKNDSQQSETVAEAKSEATLAAPTLLGDLELVHRQMQCVKHLCNAVSGLADGMILMLPKMATQGDMGHHLIKMQGDWAHRYMEWVGEMLNGMDANDPEDKRWDKTFEDAQARWKNLLDELNAKSPNADFREPAQ